MKKNMMMGALITNDNVASPTFTTNYNPTILARLRRCRDE